MMPFETEPDEDTVKLSLDEIMGEYEGHVIWIQLLERMEVCQAKYSHTYQGEDGRNYLVFDKIGCVGQHYFLKPTAMGKTWVAWNEKPSATQRREALRRGSRT